MPQPFIRHTVVFTLKHSAGSPAETTFLRDGERILTAIPSVHRFECLRQISPKNSYRFGFSMEFRDQAAYDAYSVHPAHTSFVETRWIPEVSQFLEIDYIPNGG